MAKIKDLDKKNIWKENLGVFTQAKCISCLIKFEKIALWPKSRIWTKFGQNQGFGQKNIWKENLGVFTQAKCISCLIKFGKINQEK